MIGQRSRHSLTQFLELFDSRNSTMLLGKYGVQHLSLSYEHEQLLGILCDLDDSTLMLILAEIFATSGDLRFKVNPKYRFDERMHDLTQCLLLDGYIIQDKKLVQTDPSITDAAPLEDDLITALQNSGAPRAQEIIVKINDSASAFRAAPPDYNASLVNARVALETLACDIASHVASQQQTSATYNPSKWGEVLAFLRNNSEICSGLMKPDTDLGENTRNREVSDDQATSFFYARIQARSC